ncbi:MAG: aspartyl-phosphate phosphatase Spo0E family protein [Candidatus Cohnella colombiensis]|uniref:Aspartyl-phosphate phosphatase Spo0E family protein n=1 Tax=Candidatus Cohnella colombiensis TaxID=3121368 RepID=A0AA95JFX0_9BACL|nr:MAG: aspartyl-phosphate phosphatase Spo0E family protein [Cohnella sp.]
METSHLIYRLQLLQQRLCEMAIDIGNLTDPEIVAVSEEADQLIVQLQRLRIDKSYDRNTIELYPETFLSSSQSTEEVSQQSSALFLKHS